MPYKKKEVPVKAEKKVKIAKAPAEIKINSNVSVAKKSGHTTFLIIAIAVTFIAIICAGLLSMKMSNDQNTENELAMLDALPRITVPQDYFQTASVENSFSFVKNMKSVKIYPKVDFYKDAKISKEDLQVEIDQIIKNVKTLKFNSILVATQMDNTVIFDSTVLKRNENDALRMLIDSAKKENISVAVTFPITGIKTADDVLISDCVDYKNKEIILNAMTEFVGKYELESIQLDNYYTAKTGDTYAKYCAYGMTMDFNSWLVMNTTATIDAVTKTIKATTNSLPVGLYVKDAYATVEQVEGGMPVKAQYTALKNGYADTKSILQNSIVDFVNVDIKTSLNNQEIPFAKVSSWWNETCKAANKPLYITHKGENVNNSKEYGWNGTDQLARQLSTVSKLSQYHGSSYSGLNNLMANMKTSTDILLKTYEGTYSEEALWQNIEIKTPNKTQFVTYEERVQFKGKYDPNQEVKINGEIVEPSAKGGFSVWIPLNIGKNTVNIECKGEKRTYVIERKVIIFKEVTPTKPMKVAGSSSIGLTALAYKDSKITATINGKTVTLTESGGGDENNAESAYRVYEGTYTVPKATAKEQKIGSITFKGVYQGAVQTKGGSAITIDKLADEVDPDSATGQVMTHATVTSRYANTYPFNTTPGFPQAIPYQLPQGTQDIVVNQNGNFLNLRSGKTIRAESATLEEIPFEGNNRVTQMNVGVEGNDTVIRATMSWKAPFSLDLSPYAGYDTKLGKMDYQFTADTMTLLLDYTTVIKPESVSGDMSSSPIFSGMQMKRIKNEARNIWQYQVTLPLRNVGKYYGCHATWEENTLVLRFNHGPSGGGLSGMKIAVDPGHGGKDTGNLAGRDTVEKELNLEYSYKLADSLRAMGADVVMIREGDETISNPSKVDKAEANFCDLYIAIHQNSSENRAAYGVQTYYNAPFSQPLAEAVQASVQNVAPSSKWNYWNGPKSTYNFVVTRERQFPSILVECGFLSNYEDEARAMDPSYQQQMVDAIAQGILNYYN